MDPLLLLFFPGLMAYAAASDLITMTIPNRLSLLLIAGFLALAILTRMPINEIALHLAAGAIVLVVTFSMFAFGWIGGGDAKLAAATAIWCGLGTVLEYLFVASILGGFLTLILLYWRGMLLPHSWLGIGWIARLHDKKTGIPYGIALAAAGLLIYPYTPVWTLAAGA
jgi:prepilin peptidase CpaA